MEERKFEKLLKDNEAEFNRHALRLTKDYDEAKDLVQDAMTRAYIYRDKFYEGTNFNAWVYTIMKNLFLNQCNKLKRKPTTLDINHPEVSYNIEDRSVANIGLRCLVEADMDAEINRLEVKYKSTFKMHFRGFQYKEIADTLQLPLGTVKNRIHVARKLLQQKLEHQLS
jgi:RNA polymerase sigma-70 factor (ECF subfamily)